MQAVVNLKEIGKKAKKELSKETFSKLRDISPLLHESIRMQNVLCTETQRKRKYDVCSTLGKIFRCYSSCPFLMGPPLRKCVKILSIQKEIGSNIQKTHTAQTSTTRAVITKTKRTTTKPANNSKVSTRGTTTRDANKGIKGNGTFKKARNI